MMKSSRFNFGLSVVILLSVFNSLPATGANAPSRSVSWSGLSLDSNQGWSQDILINSLSKSWTEFAMNVGNSSETLAHTLVINSQGSVRFGFFWTTDDVRYENNGQTECQISSPVIKSSYGSKSITCTTPLNIRNGETYSISVKPNPIGSNSWNASLKVKSSGLIVDLGTIIFAPPDIVIKNSEGMSGFNQTSNFDSNTTCNNLPSATVTYSRPKMGNSEAIKSVATYLDSYATCPSTSAKVNSDSSVTVKLLNPESAINAANEATDAANAAAQDASAAAAAADAAAKANASKADSILRPTKPTFSAVNFSDNTVNISVNLGSNQSTRSQKVYLVAPKLGIISSNPLLGAISGNQATWSVKFTNLLEGISIPLEIVGEKDGVKSESTIESFVFPRKSSVTVTSVPQQPNSFTSRVVGSTVVITVKVNNNPNSVASDAYLFGNSIGISREKAIKGDLVGNSAIFELPIKATMLGKNLPVTIYLSNSRGDSKPLNASLAIPSPQIASKSSNQILSKKVATVICTRATQTRTFEGKTCPPGWFKR